MGILGELDRAGLLNRDVRMVHAESLEHALSRNDIKRASEQGDARILPRRARRRADPGRVQPGGALSIARRGPREGRHPRRRARLLEGRRPRGALRQPRARRLHREDGRRRRRQSQVRGPGEHLREPGRRGAGHPRRQGRRRRRRRHPLRGAARRAGHAGDALSDQLPQIEGPRQGLRAGHRRPLLRRHLGPVDRPCLAGSGRRRRDRAGRGGRPDRDRHSRPHDRPPGRRATLGDAARRWRPRAQAPGSRPSRASARSRRRCAPTPRSPPARRAGRCAKCRKALRCSRRSARGRSPRACFFRRRSGARSSWSSPASA